MPPLRERREDIGPLATAFAQKFARRMGRTLKPLSQECLRRLRAYSWPGNVRELQNVIERVVITSPDGRLNLDRALPESVIAMAAVLSSGKNGNHRVRTAKELEVLERQNMIAALKACQWKVTGENGAAQFVGIKPTTFSSRIKALGNERKR